MPFNRRPRRRTTRGRSSVFNPSGQRFSQRFAATASRPSSLGPNVASALAPNVQAFAPEGPVFDELPPVDVDPGPLGFGAPQQDEGSSLVDAILAQEAPPPAAPPAAAGPTPITQEQVEQAGGAVPVSADPFGVSDFLSENSQYAQDVARYNQFKLARLLLEGY